MKSNIKLKKILNDLKKQPTDGAKDLNISLNQMNKLLNGKIEISDKLIHRAIKIWPINYSDFYSVQDDTKNNYLIFRNQKSKNSERIMFRGGVPYYSYKDTVLSKISPFKPELIEELVVVDDNKPNNPKVKYNNGHFLHQFTYFIGPVNFYYEVNKKKFVSKMNTGDTMYISPYIKHSFTTRLNDKKINGKILALTFSDALTNDVLNEILVLGYEKTKKFKIKIDNEFQSFWENLNYHLNILSLSLDKLKDFTGIDFNKIKSKLNVPSYNQIKKLSNSLNTNIRNLIPPLKKKEVEILNYKNCRKWFYKNLKNKIYSIKELASSNLLPMVKSIEISVLKKNKHSSFFKIPSHQYVYNIGKTKINIILENDKKDYLNPGDSLYIKPNTKHLFYKEGKLLISRINGSLSSDSVYQISSFSDDNLKKVINDNRPWFNKD